MMPCSLEELKQQRALIRKHLDWLDAKIKGLEDQASTKETDAAEAPDGGLPTRQPETEDSAASAPLPEDLSSPAHTQGDLRRAKIGCLALFIIATALFLFLLFGLPYLW